MKKIKLFLTSVTAALFCISGYAQTTVSGTVKDANGSPIPAAGVFVQGTTGGTITADDGSYSISAPSDASLQFTALGFSDKVIPVNGQTTINVILEEDSELIDETIVVAYGTAKKSSFTGSATQLGSSQLKKMQTTNISKSLEGAVAGLQTASSSGTPGSGASIQIRGFGSINASTSPLIVVDGVPYEGSLNSIPSSDIESMTVLKDAAANSMYGARGSNGVIMITTKSGQAGKIAITFDAKIGVNTKAIPDYDIVTDPGDYYELAWESIRNSVYNAGKLGYAQSGLYASGAMVPEYHLYNVYAGIADNAIIDPATGKLNANASTLKWNDTWRDVFKKGIRQEYNVTAAGGSDRTRGLISISYLNDKGIVDNSDFTRIAIRGKVDHNINKFIKTGLNISYANTNQNQYNTSEGSNYSNLSWMSQAMPPIYPLYLHDLTTGEQLYGDDGEVLYDWGDEYGRLVASSSNAYGALQTSKYSTIRDNVTSRGYINVNILPDLVASVNVAYDVFNTKYDTYMTPVGGDAKSVGGRGYQEMDRYTAMNANQLLTWTPTFGKHNLNVLLGHETKKDKSYTLYGHMTNFVDKSVSDFANATNYNDLTSYSSSYFLEGFFSRVEYNYDNRYYFTASLRRDGSSRFAKDKRWGNFWALSAAWNVKNEEFAKGFTWMDALKLKASFGTQGNDAIGYTKVYEDLYRIDRVDGEASLVKTFRNAPDVTWEKSDNFNIGLEGRFFNRLSANVEYYIKRTKDMIYSKPLPPSMGSPSSQLVNDMDMQNAGIEFDLSYDIIKRADFLWNVNWNGTHYKNKVTKIPSDWPEEGKQVGNFWREKGKSMYEYYLYEWRGVNPTTGEPQYYGGIDEETGEEIIVNNTSDAKYVKVGKTPIPDLYGGFGTTLRWRNWDASLSFAYQLGGWTLDSNYQSLMNNGDFTTNYHKDIFKRWTPNNTDTDVPRLNYGDQYSNATSTRFLIKSSYLSLRNVTLGYTIPSHILQGYGIQGVRVYFTGDNVFYVSKRKGMDVRKSFSGGNGFTYSALRTLSFGVSVTF